MKRKNLCLLLLALVACAAAQSEDDIPVENDNQFPPDNNSENEDVLNEPEGIIDDISTQPSDQPTDDGTLSTTEAVSTSTEAPNTTETSIPPAEDTQLTTQEDTVAAEDEIASNTTEASIDALDGLSVTEISTTEEPVTEDVLTETSSSLIEDVPSPEPEVQETTEAATSAEPVETVSTEPTVTGQLQTSTTGLDGTTSEIVTPGEPVDLDIPELSRAVDEDLEEPIDAVTTESSSLSEDETFPTSTNETDVGSLDVPELSVAVGQDIEETIDAATTESSTLGEDDTFPTSANETDVGFSDDSVSDVAKLSAFLPGDEQLSTTEVDLNETSEVTNSTESTLDATTEASVSLAVDVELPTDDSDVKESTDLVSSIEPVDVTTTEAITSLTDEIPTTDVTKVRTDPADFNLEGSVVAENTLQTTQINEESHNDGATVTPVSPIDPEFSIRSNKGDLGAISPLTLAEAPKEVVAPQEVDLPKETNTDDKEEDVSVGATTSVNKAGGVDKSVIGVIVAGMVLVVAGITIKKNWKSITNKFSSSPRPANDHANHTNGISPEEVPLQDKENKNPSPV